MSPVIALAITTVGIVYLFRMDRKTFAHRPATLWLPLTYMFIMSSRLPSQWLGGSSGLSIGGFADGNPLDRYIYLALLLISLRVLSKRPGGLLKLVQNYWVLCIFLAYAFLSIGWSDAPFISFKRWVRDLGIYATICVVATEPDMNAAIRLLLRRFVYLVVPLSVMLIKYYPVLGRGFSGWTGEGFNMGVSTSKNGLGAVALISILFLLWDCLVNLKTSPTRKRDLWVNIGMIGLGVWLLNGADSATALLCFFIGLAYILVVYLTPGKFKARNLSRAFVIVLLLYFPIDYATGVTKLVVQGVGRDTTFTGRTEIWETLIEEVDNPLLGVGYESFWTGSRVRRIWQVYTFRPNQAHNGYVEVYLNLGWIGVFLVVCLILAVYRDTSRALSKEPELSRLAMAVLILFIPYNYTEAAMKSSLMWYAMLLLTMCSRMALDTSPVRATAPDGLNPTQPRMPGTPLPAQPRWGMNVRTGQRLPAGANSRRAQTRQA